MSADPFDLAGRTILVTGASSGIGRQACVAIAALNGRFVGVARRAPLLQELVDATSPRNAFVAADLSSAAEVAAVVAALSARVDGVVHCAATINTRPLGFYSSSDCDEIERTNVRSIMLLMNALVRGRRLADGSSIVLVSSLAAMYGVKGNGMYSASKGALLALAPVWASELARRQIRVNCVAPGWIDTDLTRTLPTEVSPDSHSDDLARYPLGRGTVEDVAHSVVFLLSPGSRWITGQTIVVDGGRSSCM